MSPDDLWETTLEGIVYIVPEGFAHGYYIYPPYYHKATPNSKYELWLIAEDGVFDGREIYKFNTLEEAKSCAINKIQAIIKPFLPVI